MGQSVGFGIFHDRGIPISPNRHNTLMVGSHSNKHRTGLDNLHKKGEVHKGEISPLRECCTDCMKRALPYRRRWLALHASYSSRAKRRSRLKALSRRRKDVVRKIVVERRGERRTIWALSKGAVPRVFSLAENYDETISFIAGLRASMDNAIKRYRKSPSGFKRTKTSYYDLVGVRRLSPATALVFAAEYDRLIHFVPNWQLATYDAHRWQPEIRQLLEEIGFFELLEIDPPGGVRKPGHMRMTRFAYSEDKFGNEEAKKLLTEVANLLGLSSHTDEELADLVGPLRLFDALIEATENTRLHAYGEKPEEEPLVVRRWWMTGAVDTSEGKLTVVVYDQGATIPVTLPASKHRTWFGKLWKRVTQQDLADIAPENDALALRLAMSEGRSSTDLEHRGKGLPVLKRVVGTCPAGRLQINSRHGEYVYEAGQKARYSHRALPITGTLIQWDLWRPEWKQ